MHKVPQAVALVTNRKGSRGHLLNLINPSSARNVPRYPKKKIIYLQSCLPEKSSSYEGNEMRTV